MLHLTKQIIIKTSHELGWIEIDIGFLCFYCNKYVLDDGMTSCSYSHKCNY